MHPTLPSLILHRGLTTRHMDPTNPVFRMEARRMVLGHGRINKGANRNHP